ncbi:MAG: alpha/beta hydrolase [Dokdonella sp.]|uniref:alpha/beta family hydrolase n=1 Tax=Dokdonella sp. TaxID=2291710 RepID=UPI0025BFC250|nr:alpha/beta family hydrolase [Dokdonella sp.]MBX3700587.1 alpha/beta hydrolase [Dokdonella sp.]
MKGTIILSHGLESGPQATKVAALAAVANQLGWAELRPDFRDIDARREVRDIDARVARLLDALPASGRVVLAGSSMGAFISGLASLERGCAGLFLLAAPMAIPGYRRAFAAARVPLGFVHGWRDEVCPVDAVIRCAREHQAILHLVDDEHRLAAHVGECAQWFAQFLQRLG